MRGSNLGNIYTLLYNIFIVYDKFPHMVVFLIYSLIYSENTIQIYKKNYITIKFCN